MAKKKYQALAKTKYDKSHPIISIRLTPDLKKKLGDIKKISNKSVADVLKEVVRLQTPSMRKAYTKGYREARTKYAVTYNCSVCGKVITNEYARREEGWYSIHEGEQMGTRRLLEEVTSDASLVFTVFPFLSWFGPSDWDTNNPTTWI